jgi:integration host factor subunit beta
MQTVRHRTGAPAAPLRQEHACTEGTRGTHGTWSQREVPMNNGGTMTKAELVEEVSRVSDLTKKHSEVIVDTVFKAIIDALHRGEKIELRGFGSFRLRRREPRKGRNPKTGDKVDVPPKKVPYFKPGKELKELINRVASGELEIVVEPNGSELPN